MILRCAVALSAAFIVAGCATSARRPVPLHGPESLVQAERDFARSVAEQGLRDGFLAFATPDAILARMGPVDARSVLQAQPPDRERLEWSPERVLVARSDDVGVSIGPWIYASSAQTPIEGTGHFLTVWKRQPDTGWKWSWDGGVSHPPDVDHTQRATAPHALVPWSASSGECVLAELRDVETELLSARRTGAVSAQRLADDGLVLRTGLNPSSAPIVERPWDDIAVASAPTVSNAQDLAIYWGRARLDASTPAFTWLHAWTCETGRWRLKVDYSNARSS